MSASDTLKKLIALGLPDQWLVPVLNAITAPATTRKRRRRTKEQMAADAAKGRKKKASA